MNESEFPSQPAMSTLHEAQSTQHAVLVVANGGYIVHAYVPDQSGTWAWTTSVFADATVMAEYMKRVAFTYEGPEDSPQPGEKFANMKVIEG